MWNVIAGVGGGLAGVVIFLICLWSFWGKRRDGVVDVEPMTKVAVAQHTIHEAFEKLRDARFHLKECKENPHDSEIRTKAKECLQAAKEAVVCAREKVSEVAP